MTNICSYNELIWNKILLDLKKIAQKYVFFPSNKSHEIEEKNPTKEKKINVFAVNRNQILSRYRKSYIRSQ